MNKFYFNGISTLSVAVNAADPKTTAKAAVYRVDEPNARAVAGVFEGSTAYSDVTYPEHGNRSGGFIGSRAAAAATLKWFGSSNCRFDDDDATHLRSAIDLYLRRAKSTLDYEGKPLFGKKARTFPLSGALTVVDYPEETAVDCQFLWAGNCRGYVLDGYGLCQLTEDDCDKEADALTVRTASQKLTNVINADIPYRLNYRRIHVTEPMMLISSTTAAFDGFGSPMELEYAVLYALIKAKNVADWEKKLNSIVADYAEDDFAITIMSVGFGDFDDMKRYYEPRIKELIGKYIRPLNAARKGEMTVNVGDLWNDYRNGYYR